MRRSHKLPGVLTVDRLVRLVCGSHDESRRAVLRACDLAKRIDPGRPSANTGEAWDLWPLAVLDTYEIYDGRPAYLLDEVCSGDVVKFMLVLRGLDLGVLPRDVIGGRFRTISWDRLWSDVRAKAPQFAQ